MNKLNTKKHKEMKWKEAFEVLNDTVSTKLAPSKIAGVGVFALRDMKKGEKLYLDSIPNMYDLPYSKVNKLKPEIRDILLGHFPQIINGSHFWFPVNSMQAFLNHDINPNYDAVNDKALRKIKAGEELTEDYKKIDGWEKIFNFIK